ncbi:MAG TPA: S1 RNA-binding domain-containing protein [Anaerolineales bacterium]|nr:S1 RNA-binding domain-containing protein [Anaerolineales bacterium]
MDINSNAKRRYEKAMPITDEGWWESILAEEKRYSPLGPRPKQAAQKASAPVPKDQEPGQPAAAVNPDWAHAKDLFRDDHILSVKVTGHNRGGLLVEGDGLSGFVPFSHLVGLAGKSDVTDRDVSLETYTGRELKVKVIECAPEEARVVFSERAALSEPGKRSELFHTLEPGARVRGTVTNITDFGVFVDLGGVEGLIHISELSWGRVTHPNQIVGLGHEIDVQVLDLSVERCRVALSLKRLTQNPWERASRDFAEGTVLPAEVTAVVSYGAFARLEAGVEGLIHATEMSLEAGQTPRDLLKEGQQVQVRVLHVDPAHQRMGLSLKTNP